jgi:hypothetical protein
LPLVQAGSADSSSQHPSGYNRLQESYKRLGALVYFCHTNHDTGQLIRLGLQQPASPIQMGDRDRRPNPNPHDLRLRVIAAVEEDKLSCREPASR